MAVKSFQGARAQKAQTKAPHLLVKDIMCQNLVVFHPDQSIHEVMQNFVKYRISGGPVVNDAGKLIGVISEADCMKEISESRYFNMPILDKSVRNFMTVSVDTIEASKSLFEAASLFSKSSRRRYPVMERGKLVGQISRKDVVLAALNLKSSTWRRS
ncbi:MAG: CBS domain-containing protein [Flavobacteriaceae bacterium]